LLDLEVNHFKDDITAISLQATQEYKLEVQLQELADIWTKLNFEVGVDEKTDCNILKDMDDIFTALDESLAQINTILASRFVKPLRAQAEKWLREIMCLSDMIDAWLLCQKSWRYLENIFQAPDIKRSLPVETDKFQGVDKFFKNLMSRVSKTPACIKWPRQFAITLDQLNTNNEILDEVQKKLDDYMDSKRVSFPRFYFLSNDELIDILANS